MCFIIKTFITSLIQYNTAVYLDGNNRFSEGAAAAEVLELIYLFVILCLALYTIHRTGTRDRFSICICILSI